MKDFDALIKCLCLAYGNKAFVVNVIHAVIVPSLKLGRKLSK